MTEACPHWTPGPDHPITLERSTAHVVVSSGSLVVADTERALEMREASYQPVLYIPLDDVDRRLLRRSDQHTYCPYKGEASYYDIIDGNGTDLMAAVWYYGEPFPRRRRHQGPRGLLRRPGDRHRHRALIHDRTTDRPV